MAANDWRHAVLRTLGFKPTKQNLQFLSTWQRWEGGHTNNSARYNWLNTTHGPGASINSVGVKAFKSFQQGVQATAETLMNGRYQDILQGLASGDPYSYDVGAGLQTWVSGRPDGNPSYAAKVLGRSSAPDVQPHRAVPKFHAPAVVRDDSWDTAMDLIFDDDPEFNAIMKSLGQDLMPASVRQKAPKSFTQFNGKTLRLGTSWKGTHATDGLGWNTKTAADIMAAPGTAVLSPEDGEVVYFHPTGAQGGGSMLIRTTSGREYWLGHIEGGLKAGTRIKRGQQIALISGDHKNPHLHIDRRG